MSGSSVDALLALIGSARGERPTSLDDREVEDVLNITLTVLIELSVSNERIHRLEAMVADLKGIPPAELRAIGPSEDEAAERQDATDALLVRALRIMLDPREAVPGRPQPVAAGSSD